MAGTRCFMLEPTAMGMVTLRRYRSDPPASSEKSPCPGRYGYHNASSGIVEIRDATFGRLATHGTDRRRYAEKLEGAMPDFRGGSWVHCGVEQGLVGRDDPRWPRKCDSCDYEFGPADPWQVNEDLLYRRTDIAPTMEQPDLMRLREAPPGAMWFAWWLDGWRHQVGDFPLVVRLPDGHDWMPDKMATNCTKRKGEGGDGSDPDFRNHFCWVIHGTPPGLTVDKNGVTCAAGAGSIASPGGWHGFLERGQLVLNRGDAE